MKIIKVNEKDVFNKKCTDCLHFKVSVKSTKNCRLCYCAVNDKEDRHKELYWIKRPTCNKFVDMTA